MCRKSLLYFLTEYVWIQDAASQRIVRWQSWEHLKQFIDTFLHHKLILLFKSRQIGASWTIMAIACWLCLFFESSKILCFSKREDDAWDLISKAKFIVDNLPDYLRLKLDPNQRGMLGFPATHSSIKAYPSTEDAGRSTDATMVVPDEWEYHPYARENFAAVKPTIDAGGWFVGISTVNKLDERTFPKKIWYQAKAKENNFIPLFFGWNVVPTRTQEWYDRVTRDLEGWQREQEYPASETEALSAPKTICRFDTDALEDMKQDLHSPLRMERNGLVKIYKESVAGRRYCLVIDSSEGDYDPSVGQIIDWATCEKIAEYCGKIDIDEQARIAYELYERYNSAYTAVERNAGGLALIRLLVDMGLKNWHYTDNKREKPGWWTSSATRPVMIVELAEAVRQRSIREPNPDAHAQFTTFIRTDRKPEGEARGGCHDDYVMAWAVFYQIRKSMPVGSGKVVSFKYRES